MDTGRLTQAEAARILGVCERSFRRYMGRYEEEGLDGLIDRRLEQASNRQVPVYEAIALIEEYRSVIAVDSTAASHEVNMPIVITRLTEAAARELNAIR